jgi:cell division protein FtsI (penicillin-binding protein 3)
MIDDELQVLGQPRKLNKREKWKIAIIAAVLLSLVVALGMWIHSAVAPEQHEIIKSGKKIGDPTIIPELQAATDSILRAELEMLDMLQGQVIVMEVQTGEILAMVGLERNFEGKYQPCQNFHYQQELGALMQTVSLLAMLETGKEGLNDQVETGNGVWSVEDGLEMKDHNWRRGGYGNISLERALEISSNIGISKAAAKTFGDNPQQFFDILDKMSFGKPDTIEGIKGLKASSYSCPKDSDWTNWKLWLSAIGYERKIAPIQMLTFYNAIANNGKMVKPTLKTGEVEIINPQIASKANINDMKKALEHVVSRGLGRKAGTPLLWVAGKTATSEVDGLYDYLEFQLAFCGYFPANAPKYSIIVSLNKLGLPASGGGMAGVVFHDIMEWMITHGMSPVLLLDEETNDTIRITEDNIRSVSDSLSNEE